MPPVQPVAVAVSPPKPQAMARVEVLNPERFSHMLKIHNEFLSSKHFCFCLPLSESRGEFVSRYKHPSRMAMAAVALAADGTPIGFVQMTMLGVHRDVFERCFHKLRKGEAYIESLAVLDGYRGQGARVANCLNGASKPHVIKVLLSFHLPY
uniref:N-acetyltransferase domain-containing protein n=1 Tax=Tetraselmis sp. GSL018 TaxID=582737 RepID=A0A061RJV3_9CHLO